MSPPVDTDVGLLSGVVYLLFGMFNSRYSHYVRRQRLPQKGDIFPMHDGKIQYRESARNTNYTVTNVTDCI